MTPQNSLWAALCAAATLSSCAPNDSDLTGRDISANYSDPYSDLEANLYTLHDPVGVSLATEVDGIRERVNEYNGLLTISVPVLNLAGTTTHLRYVSDDLPQPERARLTGANATPLSPASNGFGERWSSNLFSRFVVGEVAGADGQGFPLRFEYADGRQARWVVPTDVNDSEFPSAGVNELTDHSQITVVGGSGRDDVIGGSADGLIVRSTQGTTYRLNHHVSNRWQREAFYPTEIEDASGNVLTIAYYDDSPIPREVTRARRKSDGTLEDIARAFFYVSLDGSARPVPPGVPDDDMEPRVESRVIGIRAPGALAEDTLNIDSGWTLTTFEYGANPWELNAIVTNGERVTFDYYDRQPLNVADCRLEQVVLPHGASLEYAWRASTQADARCGGGCPGGESRFTHRFVHVNRRTLQDPAETEAMVWTLNFLPGVQQISLHPDQWVDPPRELTEGQFGHLSVVSYLARQGEPAASVARWFGIIASKAHPGSARTGRLLHSRTFAFDIWNHSNGNVADGALTRTPVVSESTGYSVRLLGQPAYLRAEGSNPHRVWDAQIAYRARTVYDETWSLTNSARARTVLELFREPSITAEGLNAFRPAPDTRPVSDYDRFGNRPFQRVMAIEGLAPVALNRTFCAIPYCNGDQCSNTFNCEQDHIIGTPTASSPELFRETRFQYLVHDNAVRAGYRQDNFVHLIGQQDELATLSDGAAPSVVARTLRDYDFSTRQWPIAGSALGSGGGVRRGRITATERVDLERPERSQLTFTRYYGPGDGSQSNGAVAEQAVLIARGDDASSPDTYRRQRFRYGPERAPVDSVGYPNRPTQTEMLTERGWVTTDYSAYNALGLAIWRRDENNAVSRSTYDSRGRQRTSFLPGDTSPSRETIYHEPSGSTWEPRSVELVQRGDGYTIHSYTFLDGLGRPMHQQQEHHDGSSTAVVGTSTRFFRDSDQPSTVGLPYDTDEEDPSVYAGRDFPSRVQISRDALGRRLLVSGYDGSSVQWSVQFRYGTAANLHVPGLSSAALDLDWVRMTDAENRSTYQRHDAFGRLVEQILPDGNRVERRYDARGQLFEVRHPDGMLTEFAIDSLGLVRRETQPESGETSSRYNLTGELVGRTEANRNVTTFVYDLRGRETQRIDSDGVEILGTRYDTYPPNSNVTHRAHRRGRATQRRFQGGSIQFGYNARGEVVEERISLDGLDSKAIFYEYDAQAELSAMRYQPGASDELILNIDRDDDGRIYEITDEDDLRLIARRYTLSGNILQQRLLPDGNSRQLQSVDYEYDGLDRLRAINDPLSLGSDAFGMRIGYRDPLSGLENASQHVQRDGSTSWITWNSVGNQPAAYVFDYDARGMLTSAQYHNRAGRSWTPSDEYSFEADFNAVGNPNWVRRWNADGDQEESSYDYSTVNSRRLDSVNGDRAREFDYDRSGNMREDSLYGDDASLQYDSQNRIHHLITRDRRYTFRYDHGGQRISTLRERVRADEVVGREFMEHLIRDRSGNPIARYRDGELELHYISDFAVRDPAVGSAPPSYNFLVKDHLGTTRAVVPQNGPVSRAAVTDLDPFGLILEGRSSSEPVDHRVGFTGHERHEELESQLHYAGARYYDPSLLRFNRPDPLTNEEPGLSAMVYSQNRPVDRIDPTGLLSLQVQTGCCDVVVFDITSQPTDDHETANYTGLIFVISEAGWVHGPYRGSSYPDSSPNQSTTPHNTVNEGLYPVNNESGHKSGTRQGLNVVDSTGARTAPGTNPQGNSVQMWYVNVHTGYRSRRYSEGCITVHPDDWDDFAANFDWSEGGTRGDSEGTIEIYRGHHPNSMSRLEQISRTLRRQREMVDEHLNEEDDNR